MANVRYTKIAGIRIGTFQEGEHGRLLPVGFPFIIGPTTFVVCQCSCGKIVVTSLCHLRSGHATSCGCYHDEVRIKVKRTHGMTGTSEYHIWNGLRQRCLNPENDRYHAYGTRGITVCERWSRFENFLEDMGMRPSAQHSIDRIDNDGPYAKDNCRWATMTEQCNNRRTCVNVTLYGTQKTITEWSRISMVPAEAIRRRLIRGWEPKTAVFYMDEKMTDRINKGLSK